LAQNVYSPVKVNINVNSANFMDIPSPTPSPNDEHVQYLSSDAIAVCLAEDHRVNYRLVESQLRKLGCAVVHAHNGQEALDIVRNPHNQIELLICDINMPILSGIAVTQEIRKCTRNVKAPSPTVTHQNKKSICKAENCLCTLPIVAMTADASESTKKNCFDSGMNDFLLKPASLASLAQTITKWVRMGSQRLSDFTSSHGVSPSNGTNSTIDQIQSNSNFMSPISTASSSLSFSMSPSSTSRSATPLFADLYDERREHTAPIMQPIGSMSRSFSCI
jgi:CheY-like chemotaxis protein